MFGRRRESRAWLRRGLLTDISGRRTSESASTARCAQSRPMQILYVHSCTSWIQQWGFSKPLGAPKRNRKGGRQRKARTRWQSKKPECNAKRLAYTCSFPSPSCENRLPPFWARPFSAPGDVALSTISVASC